MKNEWLISKIVAATPLLMVIALVAFYWLFQSIYITCNLWKTNPAGCTEVNLNLLFQPTDSAADMNPQVTQCGSCLDLVKNTEKEKLPETRQIVIGESDSTPPKFAESRGVMAARYSGRNTWVFITFTSIVLSIGGFIVAVFLIYKSERCFTDNLCLDVGIFIGTSLLLGLLLWSAPDFFMYNLCRILRLTIQNGLTGVSGIVESMRFVLAFTFTVIFALIFATCAILYVSERDESDTSKNGDKRPEAESQTNTTSDLQKKFDVLSAKLTDLRMMLYAGTVMLVVGVLRLSIVYQWSLSFVTQEEETLKAMQAYTSSLVNDMGGFFTLVLAAVYIPAVYIIHRRAQYALKESTKNDSIYLPSKEQELILEKHGFTFTFKEALPRSFIILSPLLTGPAGELLKAIVN